MDTRGERLLGTVDSWSRTSRLASLSPVSLPYRNERPGVRRSLIEKKKRKDSSCQMCQRVRNRTKNGREKGAVKAERESERRIKERKWQVCWWCRDQLKVCRMVQALHSLNTLDLPNKKGLPQRHIASS